MPSTAAISSTESRASWVSIWTMVRRLSLACWRYSVMLGLGLKRSMAKGEPKPRRPRGGNFEARTRSLASWAVRSRGTRICRWVRKVRGGTDWRTRWVTYTVSAAVKGACSRDGLDRHGNTFRGSHARLTIHGCMSGSLTIGETFRAAMAGTASCMAASARVSLR
jgi:hypothetical protein